MIFLQTLQQSGYTEFVDALERAEEECRQCGIAAAMAAGTTLGHSALQAGDTKCVSGSIWVPEGFELRTCVVFFYVPLRIFALFSPKTSRVSLNSDFARLWVSQSSKLIIKKQNQQKHTKTIKHI